MEVGDIGDVHDRQGLAIDTRSDGDCGGAWWEHVGGALDRQVGDEHSQGEQWGRIGTGIDDGVRGIPWREGQECVGQGWGDGM